MRTMQRCAKSLRKGDVVVAYGPTWKTRTSPIVHIEARQDCRILKTQAGDTLWARPSWKYTIQR